MKLKKGDYLYKESNGMSLIYKITSDDITRGTIVWSKGDNLNWEEGRKIHNISSSSDTFFAVVKKISDAEYLAKVI